MKTSFVLISALMVMSTLDIVSAADRRAPFFRIPVIGFTDLNGIDYIEGFASGLWGTDMRGQWEGCLNGFPTLFEELWDIVKDIFSNLSNPVKLFTNFGRLQKIFNLLIQVVKDGPKDFKDCSLIITEITTGVGFIIKKINFATLTTGLAVNVGTHILQLLTDVAAIFSSLIGWDWFSLGQNEGEILMILFN